METADSRHLRFGGVGHGVTDWITPLCQPKAGLGATAEVVAIAGPGSLTTPAAEQYQISTCYGSLAEMVYKDKRLDGVVIGVTSSNVADQIRQALAARLHVLLHPLALATGVVDLASLVDQAKKNGCVFVVGYDHLPLLHWPGGCVASGKLGELTGATVTWRRPATREPVSFGHELRVMLTAVLPFAGPVVYGRATRRANTLKAHIRLTAGFAVDLTIEPSVATGLELRLVGSAGRLDVPLDLGWGRMEEHRPVLRAGGRSDFGDAGPVLATRRRRVIDAWLRAILGLKVPAGHETADLLTGYALRADAAARRIGAAAGVA